MAKNLKTEFKRIGRSGPTVDGRHIEPQSLEQAAKNYNKELFTALIWPDHIRWYNMGTVDELRTEANDEGGIDLYAVIVPNQFYLDSNKHGQRLFTSMELMPNFRDTGEYYLTGLAATDDPASAATSEMRFSKLDNKEALLASFVQNETHTFTPNTDDQPPRWFSKLFNIQPNEDDMDKKALAALTEQFKALNERIAKSEPATTTDETEETPTNDYAALTTKVDSLLEKFEALDADKSAAKATVSTEDFNALQTDFKDLLEKFTAAIGEEQGTDAGENYGGELEVSQTDC